MAVIPMKRRKSERYGAKPRQRALNMGLWLLRLDPRYRIPVLDKAFKLRPDPDSSMLCDWQGHPGGNRLMGRGEVPGGDIPIV